MKIPKKRAAEPGEPVLTRFQADLLGKIDDWRRRQADLPGRAETVRRLVTQALEATIRKKP